MHIRELKSLRAVIATGTMVQAAEVIGVTQPAISGLIASLERKLGMELFERVGGRLVPRPEAIYLAREAEKVILSFDRLYDISNSLKGLQTGQLTIACFPGLSLHFLPNIISKFSRDKPNVSISLLTRWSAEIREWMFGESIDIGIAEWPVHISGLSYEAVKLKCVCIVPPGHKLAQYDVITPSDLDGLPLATLYRDHPTTHQLEEAFSKASSKLNKRFEVRLFASACSLVANGSCISVVDPIVANEFSIKNEVVIKPFFPEIHFEIGILFPTNTGQSFLTKAFSELLSRELAAFL